MGEEQRYFTAKKDFILAKTALVWKSMSSHPAPSLPLETSLPSSEMNPMSAWTYMLFLQATQMLQFVSSLHVLSMRDTWTGKHIKARCPVSSLQLLGDAASTTGHLARLGGSNFEFTPMALFLLLCCKPNGVCYFRCISLIRAVLGMERAGLCSCSCWHTSRMEVWLYIPSHQRAIY